MSTPPTVNRLVLYKHGVAFIGRRGPVDGDFALTFRRDDMKDVLKSLTVNAVGGHASLGTVAFDTPADPRTELANRNLLLSPGEALVGLIDALRGRTIEVHCGKKSHRGEVIGTDSTADARDRLLVLRAETGAVSLVELATVRRLDLLETPSQGDLDYLVDRSRAATAGQNCDVTVQVRGTADDVQVSYIVPAPVWRVSYRVIRDGDSLVLAAMGIIHNPVDEDLTDVEVTLTTGQPISFDIDLYHGKHVQRKVVEESDRVAAPRRAYGAMPVPPGAAAVSASMISVDDYLDAPADVDTADRGEYFEYRLATPVSLKRGGAAMVPLAVAHVDEVHRELVWRKDRGPAPDIELAFANTTGVVLEEGPAVVYEQDSYAGEAMLGFTARGAAVRLVFAKDLAVRCRSDATSQTITTRIRLADAGVIEEQRRERRHTLRAENDHDDQVEVIFELPATPDSTVVAQDGVSEVTRDASWHRFSVPVPGHRTAAATVLESWPVYREIAYDDLEPGQLEQWLADRSLDAATVGVLRQVLAHWNIARHLDSQGETVQEQLAEVYAAQSRIAEQLRVLGTDGAEGDLRARQVHDLDALQDRANGLGAEVRRLRDEADTARQAASAELQRVIGEAAG